MRQLLLISFLALLVACEETYDFYPHDTYTRFQGTWVLHTDTLVIGPGRHRTELIIEKGPTTYCIGSSGKIQDGEFVIKAEGNSQECVWGKRNGYNMLIRNSEGVTYLWRGTK